MAAVALALVVSAVVADGRAGLAQDGSRHARPLITPDEARSLAVEFNARSAAAASTLDTDALDQIEGTPVRDVDEFRFRLARRLGRESLPVLAVEGVEVVVPRRTRFPVAFLAINDLVGDDSRVLLFERESASQPWRVTLVGTGSDPNLPRVTLDAEGYARRPTTAKLAAAPSALPKKTCRLIDGGDDAAVGYTDGLDPVLEHQQELEQQAQDQRVKIRTRCRARPTPLFAVATDDGAFAMYSVTLDTSARGTNRRPVTVEPRFAVEVDELPLIPPGEYRAWTSTQVAMFGADIYTRAAAADDDIEIGFPIGSHGETKVTTTRARR